MPPNTLDQFHRPPARRHRAAAWLVGLAGVATALLLSAQHVANAHPDGSPLAALLPTADSIAPIAAPDPAAGRRFLLHGDYIGAGIPLPLWKQLAAAVPKPVRYLDRDGVDPSVPDDMNQYRTPRGVEVVSGVNCLGCHASRFRGDLVIGMGNSLRDWSGARNSYAPLKFLASITYADGAPERDVLREFIRGAEALDGTAFTPTRGLNPAFRFEEVAAAYRHPADLSWSEQPLYDIPDAGVWSDVPPWWTLRKKLTLYYNGMGQGDFARLIQQIGVVMISDARDAERTLPHMQDVIAYIKTLRPPAHPGPIDTALRDAGAEIFAARCADCHGTYSSSSHTAGVPAHETYPNKLIPIDEVGTDPVYAQRIQSSGIHGWFNRSWFAGQGAAYADATLAYVAPPLDGVWCTAPYFHNGSVPTLEAVLNSRSRPQRWRRSFDEFDYDTASPGWRFDAVPPTFIGPPSRLDYDTTHLGCGNQGHTYGDDLSDAERRAVIEYLKTL